MQEKILSILQEFEKKIKEIFKDDFHMMLLYGSYARGDFHENSDIDVMILVKTPMEKINQYYDTVSDCAFEFLMKYKVDISPIVKNIEHFDYWKDDLPYYNNVYTEGVAVHG